MLKPISPSRWNATLATHLLQRAGFGGTPLEIEEFTRLGPEKAVDRLVQFDPLDDPAPPPADLAPDPGRDAWIEEMAELRRKLQSATPEERAALEDQRRQLQRRERQDQQRRLLQLRRWWLSRMAHGSRPLQEKLTLFWHGHFATSIVKVREPWLMYRQNEIFRSHGAGSWLRLLTEVSKDPAMLIWLDQAQSRRQHPNENFAREVMELFALGEGQYSEKDVLEAARALTGWTLDRPRMEFQFRRPAHDPGLKTLFGKTGPFDGDDVLRLILEHPAAAPFICRKLWTFFAQDPAPEPVVAAMADLFRKNGMTFRPVLRALFLSEAFYDPTVIRNQIKSPVQWLVGSIRLLERELPSPPECSQMLAQLGQELFAPPNVKGWDGGVSWITTNILLNRYNFAAHLVHGGELAGEMMRTSARPAARGRRLRDRLASGTPPVRPDRLLTAEERRDPKRLLAALQRRFIQGSLKPQQVQALEEYLRALGELDEEDLLNAIRMVMSIPEYQLA